MTRPARMVLAAAAIGAIVVGGVVWKPWSTGQAAGPSNELPHLSPSSESPMTPDDAKRDKFAQDKAGAIKAIPFDGDRAMKYLKQLCEIGPRVSGSEGMKKQQELLIAHFEKQGGKVSRQDFEAKQHSKRDKVAMTNLIVAWHPERTKRVILCAHYDTRPLAHEEPNRQNWNKPFVSANDGTSGVAFLMEMAHQMKDIPTTFGVDFVIFDGEEYVFETAGQFGGGDKYFFGSEHFADQYAKNLSKTKSRYEAAILFDLFAHPGAVFPVEENSFTFAPKLVEQVWQVAATVGAKSFKWEAGPQVLDDHLALNRAGIPTVDVIDFEGYKAHWHKLSDTPDKCSGAQMAEVAKVVTAWLQLIR